MSWVNSRWRFRRNFLRVLESGEIRRVGAQKPEFPDVRIVAATNRDLSGMVSEGLFREDLLFRLQVLAVSLPPLRERKADILRLAEHICSVLSSTCTMSDRVRNMLWDYTVGECTRTSQCTCREHLC